MRTLKEERCEAMALLQAGKNPVEVAKQLQRSESWVRKWRQRFRTKGYAGLEEQSRRPKKLRQLSTEVREAIIKARMHLEEQARQGIGLKYIGGRAVRSHLRQQKCDPLPSVASIERVLRQAGLTQKKEKRLKAEIDYPHVQAQRAQELIQVDIVPHYLQGGERVACFNAIDPVSRYPTGQAKSQRRSVDAADFLVHVWQTMGVPTYTQVDNEGCFSGGATHPYVLGRVVRLALQVGTQLLFSPIYHPQSNGYVERFHQDYDRHVWEDTYLADLVAVDTRADTFFAHYRLSDHHSALAGQTPTAIHFHTPPRFLAAEFQLPDTRQPLMSGQVHFIRRIQTNQTVRVLNVDWHVPPTAASGVWVTLDLQPTQTQLLIYDTAPDQPQRRCLITHPFPVEEEVHPHPSSANATHTPILQTVAQSMLSTADSFFSAGRKLLQLTFTWSV